MVDRYVVIYINGNPENDSRAKKILEKFEELKIKHKLINLNEEIDLYGNKMTLEGFFALDFSGMGDVKVPRTPFAVAEDKIFDGFDKISENLDYLARNYAEAHEP